MSNPDRKSLRPRIDTAPAATAEEAFQNAALRPILKLQHDPLTATFHHYLAKRKVRVGSLSKAALREKTAELLTRDNRLRGLLFGMVVGWLDTEELRYYLAHESAVNRRITSMLIERLGVPPDTPSAP